MTNLEEIWLKKNGISFLGWIFIRRSRNKWIC